MAFVFEELNETDKTRYDWSMFKGWTGHMPYPPPYWSIDKTKDIFFIWVQGSPHETDEFPIYALYWMGHIIRIEAQRSGVGKFEEGVDTTWTIRKIHIPDELKAEASQIAQVLKDAITIQPAVPTLNIKQKSLTIKFEGAAA